MVPVVGSKALKLTGGAGGDARYAQATFSVVGRRVRPAVGMKIRRPQEGSSHRGEAKAAKTEAAKDNLENLAARGAAGDSKCGLGLIGMVEGAQESPLLRRISAIRKAARDRPRAICCRPVRVGRQPCATQTAST